MASVSRRLKRHGCPNARERAVTMGKIDVGLAVRGKELSREGREHVLGRMVDSQAMRMELSRQRVEMTERDRLLALMREQSREPEADMGGDA